MAWLKSHHWVTVPHTVTEIRREMNVRESRHTAMVWNERNYDPDTGKCSLDKIPKLNNSSLADIVVDDNVYTINRWHSYYDWEDRDKEFDIPKFIPKDNDFEEECRLDNEKQKLADAYKEENYFKPESIDIRMQAAIEYNKKKFEEEKRKREKLKQKAEEIYQRNLKLREEELRLQQEQKTLDSQRKQIPESCWITYNIVPNKWIPK